jgi:hypothetical protein
VFFAKLLTSYFAINTCAQLPPNPLDQLTELMGGESQVAEMTGRKGMMVRGADGKVSYKVRHVRAFALRDTEVVLSHRRSCKQ